MLDVIIGRHTWNCQIRTHIHTGYTHIRTHKKKVERLGKKRKKSRKNQKKKEGGSGKKVRRKGRKENGGKRRRKMREKGREGKKRKKKKKEGGGWVEGCRGARVLRSAGPHTDNARST